jgi:hypothetical protein
MSSGWWRGIALILAVLLLNVSLTFHNIWPTPAITWRGEISVELGAYLCLAALVGAARRRKPPFSRRMLRILAVLWLLFVLGRYADVTATALFGRDINLYWICGSSPTSFHFWRRPLRFDSSSPSSAES